MSKVASAVLWELLLRGWLIEQTHSRSDKSWQNDYFLISKKLASNLSDCKVTENEYVKEYSDHNPVLIELKFKE